MYFQLAVCERVPVIRRAVADVVLEIDLLAPAAPFVADEREQASSVDRRLAAATCGFEKRRQDIAQLHRLRPVIPRFAGIMPVGQRISIGIRPDASYAYVFRHKFWSPSMSP